MLDDGQLNISVFFGFSELTHSGIVVDPFNLHTFVSRLTTPCAGDLQACGFNLQRKPTSNEPGFTLVKRLEPPLSPSEVHIELYDSAVADNYQAILQHFEQPQEAKSEIVQAKFLQALAEQDAVLYIGHARLGTGPSFSTFESFSANWWHAMLTNQNRQDMLHTLSQREQPLPLLGLYACDTDFYYRDDLQQASPETALLLSRGATYTDTDSQRLFGTLEALLQQGCKAEYQPLLSTDSDSASYRLTGLFSPVPQQQLNLKPFNTSQQWVVR